MRTRFAPSPTGYLHLGHAFAAKIAFGFAARHHGECLLRVEDIDTVRCKPQFTQAIYKDLAWLGFEWAKPVRVQSEHLNDYRAVIDALREKSLVYRCFKTRKDIPPGLYRGGPLREGQEAEKMAAGETFAWRLSMARCHDVIKGPLTYEETGENSGTKTIDLDRLGDEILARKDIGTSYHVACCHDDALQNITHIVRGMDIAPLTPFQRVLQDIMGWPEPIYHHHPLLRKPSGEKLAKRSGDTSLRVMRQQGFTAAQLLDMASA